MYSSFSPIQNNKIELKSARIRKIKNLLFFWCPDGLSKLSANLLSQFALARFHLHHEAEAILQILLNPARAEDRSAWNFSQREYT